LLLISYLSDDPDLEFSATPEISRSYSKFRLKFEKKAREWTIKYARISIKTWADIKSFLWIKIPTFRIEQSQFPVQVIPNFETCVITFRTTLIHHLIPEMCAHTHYGIYFFDWASFYVLDLQNRAQFKISVTLDEERSLKETYMKQKIIKFDGY
jgi:hypothetical protein